MEDVMAKRRPREYRITLHEENQPNPEQLVRAALILVDPELAERLGIDMRRIARFETRSKDLTAPGWRSGADVHTGRY